MDATTRTSETDVVATPRPRVVGIKLSALNARRWQNFKANRRGY